MRFEYEDSNIKDNIINILLSQTKYDVFSYFSKNLLTTLDNIPELRILLEENFILEDNKYNHKYFHI